MPIPMKTLKKVSQIYVHKHCADGLASAMILQDAFRLLEKTVPITFIAHNTPEHETAGLDACEDPHCDMVLFCDMAPSRKFMRRYGARKNFIILDHHSKQRDIVEDFGERGIYADEPGVSGALLAFREVWEPAWNQSETLNVGDHRRLQQNVKEFAECVGARDTWQIKSPRFLPGSWAAQMLMSKPAEYWLNPRGTNEFGDPSLPEPFLHQAEVSQGKVLYDVHMEAVAATVKQCVFYEIRDKTKGAVELFVFPERTSGFRLTSDVAEAIRQPSPMSPQKKAVVAGFSYNVDSPGADPILVYSLRGINGYDVSALATCNGGGGHDLASGFSIPIRKAGAIVYQDPYETIRERVERFLLTGDGWATPYKEKP